MTENTNQFKSPQQYALLPMSAGFQHDKKMTQEHEEKEELMGSAGTSLFISLFADWSGLGHVFELGAEMAKTAAELNEGKPSMGNNIHVQNIKPELQILPHLAFTGKTQNQANYQPAMTKDKEVQKPKQKMGLK